MTNKVPKIQKLNKSKIYFRTFQWSSNHPKFKFILHHHESRTTPKRHPTNHFWLKCLAIKQPAQPTQDPTRQPTVSTCAGWRVTTKLINKAAAELAAQRSCCWALPRRFDWGNVVVLPRGLIGRFVEVWLFFFENEVPKKSWIRWKKEKPWPFLVGCVSICCGKGVI